MKDILDEEQRQVLEQLAWSNVLLAFDYDGTLAPIVDDPQKARLRERTRDLLERLARVYPCIVISGRAQEDVLKRLRGTGIYEAIGNHGLEPWRRTEAFAVQVQEWRRALERELRGLEGVVVEDKVFSLAVHYRHARSRKASKAAILDVAARLQEVRIVGGKCVVNLIPRGAPHKGMALESARDQRRCDVALYVGDDETDEDVFALDDPGRLLTIRVGQSAASRASFFLREQRHIDLLLARLLRLRRERKAG